MDLTKFWSHRNGEIGEKRDDYFSCFLFPLRPSVLILALRSQGPHFLFLLQTERDKL